MSVLIFGHKNPDSDSVCSSICLSHLKNQEKIISTPYVLGKINRETQFILDYFEMTTPKLLNNVNIQVKDLNINTAQQITPDSSILSAYKAITNSDTKTLCITNNQNKLLGIVTMKDIAMDLILGDFYHLNTSLKNIKDALDGIVLSKTYDSISGNIKVIAYNLKNSISALKQDSIIIVGDRYDVIDKSIEKNVSLIIITGGRIPPKELINKAMEYNVPMISVKPDTFTTSKLINQCNYVSTIMKTTRILKFNLNSYLSEVKDELLNSSYRNYPIVDEQNTLYGFINRRLILNPSRKKVILVDHNEHSQSADGLADAEILEVIDHHKIGDIRTNSPISFRNLPVGSTCTIVYKMFLEKNIPIPYKIAGLLLSGIISDTLFMKSPTSTTDDKNAIDSLNKILKLNLDQYSHQMFKAGTALGGYSVEEIFFKDFKEYYVDIHKIGISQIFTLDYESVFKRKDLYIDLINKTHKERAYFLTILLITDIVKEGSYIMFNCNNKQLIPIAFNCDNCQGIFVNNIVSRKKQAIPLILEALNMIR